MSKWSDRLKRAVASVRAPEQSIAAHCGTNHAMLREWMRGDAYPTDDEYRKIVQKLPLMVHSLEELRADRDAFTARAAAKEAKRAAKKAKAPPVPTPFVQEAVPVPAPTPWAPTAKKEYPMSTKEAPIANEAVLEKALQFQRALSDVGRLKQDTIRRFCALLAVAKDFNISTERLSEMLLETATAPESD